MHVPPSPGTVHLHGTTFFSTASSLPILQTWRRKQTLAVDAMTSFSAFRRFIYKMAWIKRRRYNKVQESMKAEEINTRMRGQQINRLADQLLTNENEQSNGFIHLTSHILSCGDIRSNNNRTLCIFASEYFKALTHRPRTEYSQGVFLTHRQTRRTTQCSFTDRRTHHIPPP